VKKSLVKDVANTWASRTRCKQTSRARRVLYWQSAIAALALSVLLTPTSASAASSWWNAHWQYRKAITLKLPSVAVGGAAPAVVLPIRLHAGNFEYF
jgi:hypothetical protein